MKLLTGLFRAARKRTLTTDNDLGQFRAKLEELVSSKDSLSDEDVVKRVDELKEMTIDLPDEEEKAKLDRFLEDFKTVKEQDEATAKEAASMVADLFEKLDTEAMKDIPDVGAEEETETVEETETEETEAPLADGEEATEEAEVAVEETVAPEGEEKTEDADAPFDEYTLEEIYQYVKKRMDEELGAEDGACDGAEEVEEAKEEEEKEEEVVTDHAPHIPVTMNGTSGEGTLRAMFENIKKGGR